jgi:hypothetical protein
MSDLSKLSEPFPAVMVKKNPHGLDYVPVAEVVNRMNSVVGAGRWRVEILRTKAWGEQETAFGLCPVHVIATVRVHVYDPTWAKLVRTFGVDRGECVADVFG